MSSAATETSMKSGIAFGREPKLHRVLDDLERAAALHARDLSWPTT